MQSFELKALLGQHQAAGANWSEFLRVPALSFGVSHAAGRRRRSAVAPRRGRVYLVLSGQAAIQVGDEDQSIAARIADLRPGAPTIASTASLKT